MHGFVYSAITLLCLANPAMADGILGKIQKGAEDAAEAVGQGAERVGDTIDKGVGIVGDTVKSTTEMATNEATPEETRAKLDVMSNEILAQLLAQSADAAAMYDISAGYAIFDSRKVTIFPVSAGYGRGVAISKEDSSKTYMNMATGGVGAALGIGGFESQFVIMFETPGDYTKFIVDGYDATAETSTMHGDDQSGEAVRFIDGRSFFVLDKKGWRVAASAAGTKYWMSPELN
ncbi:hypothetical protein [Roseovarius sp. EL26]|uniref:hypothetical protein n=1 Tax=Roseovarius sp. EL26 TaxID=2126672 RepID=UPI0013C43850|nr:hypothetical protein [Roseovarius sp. EL26]